MCRPSRRAMSGQQTRGGSLTVGIAEFGSIPANPNRQTIALSSNIISEGYLFAGKGGTGPVLAKFPTNAASLVLRVEDYGGILFGELSVYNGSGVSASVYYADTDLPEEE